ncbi:amino acid adenylation domain-containing protein [Streptosporangiaceae bacterium NEAU-GS5]|nr:amino acid adenylation domain-containing protein [Streptosporangiaceae bacterium NEAU-GS5]
MTIERPALSESKRALLEQRLRRRPADGPPRIPRRPAGAAPPLSFAQERVWFMEQYAPGTAAYAVPIAVRLRGPLDTEALRRALDGVTDRHETLRMSFPAGPDGSPEVRVADAVRIPLEVVDAPADEVRELLRTRAAEPFDLARGPLLRALLAVLGEDDHLLVLAGHHIAGDGWSSDVLLGDLIALYRAESTGVPAALPEPPVQYGDFARWQREQLAGPGFERHRRYWAGRLADVPALELPADHPRPKAQRFEGATHRFDLDPELGGALGRLSRVHGATLFMTLLAAYQTLLARHCGQDDFAVGTPVAGRSRPEVEGLVGMFVNMLALRAELSGDPSFAELLARTRPAVLDALDHQELPFEHIVNELGVARDVSRSPLFQVTFAMHNFAMRTRTAGDGGLTAGWEPLDLPATRFDLELHVVAGKGGGLRCAFTYSTALFEAATIIRLAERFGVLLASIAAAPETPLSRLALLPAAERTTLIEEWNDTAVAVPPDATLHGLVEAQAARTPTAVAVVSEQGALTYAELNRRANRIAHRLRDLGAGPETLVAVCAERSADLVAGLLGVLKSGAAYVPLDPGYPPDRLAYMIDDSAAPILLTQRALAPPETPAHVLALDEPAEWTGFPDTDPELAAGPVNPAYVIYTSGSTGRPKGVPNTHAGICNRLDWMQRTYSLTSDDAVLQKTPAGFDVSVWEFFWPLLAGARLVLARPGGQKDPAYLRDLIIAEGVTTAHFVPSMLAAFTAEPGVADCRSLRRVICSGEELPPQAAARFMALLPDCELHNLYGPTEAAVDVSAWRCDPSMPASASTVPIGRPIQNIRLYVLDSSMEPAPIGVAGELHIGGVGVARGYWRRPALTAERFVPDPYGPPGSRLYRTGDLARWTPGGVLEFLGRGDGQIKLRGLRIELGEIESRLREQPGIQDAVVVVRDDPPLGKRLVAYVVPEAVHVDAVGAELKRTLPDYMVPAAFVELPALPLTPNGKLNRAALPTPMAAPGVYTPPQGPAQELVARIWADVLGVDQVGAHDDFFDLGGHSMLAMQVVVRLRTALEGTGRSVGVMDLFTHRTVAELGAYIEGPAPQGPRRLLYELTPPVPPPARVRSYICLPYGGGSAAVYQPLADALPAGHSLYALAIPGHDVGLDEAALPFDELAERTTAEVLRTTEGPLVLYGHCGVGGALVVELARRLEDAGRELEAVYVGAIFPFARTNGPLSRVLAWLDRRASGRHYAAWLTSMGVDMGELDPAQADRIIANMRADGRRAEAYFGDLLDRQVDRLHAPVISVVGERDPATDYYQERHREWRFLTDTSAVVVLDEAGHFFLRYRAEELAEIITTTHLHLTDSPPHPAPGATWWLHPDHEPHPKRPEERLNDQHTERPNDRPDGRRRDERWPDKRPNERRTEGPTERPDERRPDGSTERPDELRRIKGPIKGRIERPAERPDEKRRIEGPVKGRIERPINGRIERAIDARPPIRPTMRRFSVVASGQLISMAGSALTAWAIPVWIYLRTGSLVDFTLFAVSGLVPALLVGPLAGAVVDRADRRVVMMAAGAVAGGCELALGLLYWSGRLQPWHIYLTVAGVASALAFQRLAFTSAIPQLVPKRFLGNANGVAQMSSGFATLLVPLVAAGLLATIGLGWILILDVVSYAAAIGVLTFVRFPDTMGKKAREPLLTEIANGFRYSWGNPALRAMLLFSAMINVFLGPALILVSPLVLGFGTLTQVGQVSFAEAIGALIGGVVFTIWGGPARRMRGLLLATFALAACCMVTGLRPAVAVVAAGVFGTAFTLAVIQSIYATIVQVKVPQRFHGRVFALNQMIAWSTLPLGFAVIAPLASATFEPLLRPSGPLAGTLGTVIGTGPGRGIALVYLAVALTIAALTALGLRTRILSTFDSQVPDAQPDDLIGLQSLPTHNPSP